MRLLAGGTGAALLLLAASVLTASGQERSATAPELKAAFLVNFMKFTEWPPEALTPAASLVACVVGDPRVADEMQALTHGRKIADRDVKVSRMTDAPVAGCHLVFWSASDTDNVKRGFDRWSAAPVLTVSDLPEFAERYGIVGFFVERGRMRFAVNPAAAERAGIRINSRLLSLARIVKGR